MELGGVLLFFIRLQLTALSDYKQVTSWKEEKKGNKQLQIRLLDI
jgi:hypothetical protein